jgi:hypothetical protein
MWPIPLLFALPVALSLDSPGPNAPPTVDLGYARCQGVSNTVTGNTEFLGVRSIVPCLVCEGCDIALHRTESLA